MRKVLFFSGMHSTKYGSLEKWFLLLGEYLHQKNMKLIIHYNSQPGSQAYLQKLEELGVEILTKHPPRGSLPQILFFSKITRKVDPFAVHALFSSKPLYGAFLAGVPRIYWTNALEMPAKKLSHSFSFKAIDRMCTIFSASDSIREQMIRSGFRRRNVHTLYFGLPVEHMDFSGGSSPISAGSIPGGDSIRICCVSHYRHVKGVDLLLRAFKKVTEEVPAAKLLQIGVDTDKHHEFLEQSERMGLEEHVLWAGIVDDAYKLIQLCDIYVQPSRREAMGFTVMEASYQEKPVVAFRVGGIPEAVEHGYNGLLAEPENTDELANYIVMLAKDEEQRRIMGKNGKVKAETLLSSGRIKHLVDNYYS